MNQDKFQEIQDWAKYRQKYSQGARYILQLISEIKKLKRTWTSPYTTKRLLKDIEEKNKEIDRLHDILDRYNTFTKRALAEILNLSDRVVELGTEFNLLRNSIYNNTIYNTERHGPNNNIEKGGLENGSIPGTPTRNHSRRPGRGNPQ